MTIRAIVDATRGAKILSMRDSTGREWLAQAAPTARRGDDFLTAEMAGWDECAPSIVACEWGDRAIPDHGDLWNAVFDRRGDTVSARGSTLNYYFERTIQPIDGGLRLSYRAEALERDIPFLWAAHPQFAAPRGTRVRVVVTDVVDVQAATLPVVPFDGSIDTVEEGGCRKVYLQPDEQVTEAELVRPDGGRLRMRWSDNLPYLGIWFDKRYSREPVIAIEPSTGYFDSLANAVERERVAMLRRGEPLHWWLELRD